MNLTAHFTLEELTASETAERNGWDNSPNDQELANLVRLAEFLEQVKEVLAGKPIIISSGLAHQKGQ
jgi:zinc D-Ala-D-Ala carboxypeptidase